ncbi:MAG: DUF5656 family protein [Burkholderiales bacterium]
MKEFTRARAAAAAAERSQALTGAISRLDWVYITAVLLALLLTLFLAAEPTQNWLLLLSCGVAALGADGVVRRHPRARFERLDDTALFLFVPVLMTLGIGLFLEEVADGHWTIAAGLLSAVPFWLVLRAEYECVDRKVRFQRVLGMEIDAYHLWRGVLNIATYVTAFLFFSTMYDFDLDLLTLSFAAGVVSFLLAIEVLREEALDTSRTILFAIAIGALLGQAAWSTHFLPLEGSSAAVFLLLAFYLMTGMMHNYLGERLNARTGSEFAVIALAGLATVVATQSYV